MSIAAGKKKATMRKVAYIERYGIAHTGWWCRHIDEALLSQLSFCKSEEARRLLLGVSRKFADGEAA